MNATPSMNEGLPQQLLLASDLSARCDRALDRGAQLAAAWQAELVVLNVASAAQAPDLALAWAVGQDDAAARRHATRQLQADVAGLGVRSQLRVLQGEAAESIRDEAARSGSDLVIAGMARDEPFGRFLVGSTVQTLARTLAQPLLVVDGEPVKEGAAIITYLLDTHANDLLPGQEGKLQFAFEHPGIGIKENKLKPGDGLVAVHLRVDLDGIQTDGDEGRVLEDDSGADDGRHGARWTPISLPERRPGQDAQGQRNQKKKLPEHLVHPLLPASELSDIIPFARHSVAKLTRLI